MLLQLHFSDIYAYKKTRSIRNLLFMCQDYCMKSCSTDLILCFCSCIWLLTPLQGNSSFMTVLEWTFTWVGKESSQTNLLYVSFMNKCNSIPRI